MFLYTHDAAASPLTMPDPWLPVRKSGRAKHEQMDPPPAYPPPVFLSHATGHASAGALSSNRGAKLELGFASQFCNSTASFILHSSPQEWVTGGVFLSTLVGSFAWSFHRNFERGARALREEEPRALRAAQRVAPKLLLSGSLVVAAAGAVAWAVLVNSAPALRALTSEARREHGDRRDDSQGAGGA